MGVRYYGYMKNTGHVQIRSKLVSQLLGLLGGFEEKPFGTNDAGALRYELLRVRGRMAYLEPITLSGDRSAIVEFKKLIVVEKELTNEMENLTKLRMRARSATRLLLPVL